MVIKTENVYAIFEEKQLSCDSDYGSDGFIIVWDSEELVRNCTTCELMKAIENQDDETFDEVVEYMKKEYELDYSKDSEQLDDSYFNEVLTFLENKLGDSGFYEFDYQTVSTLREIHKTKEKADAMVKYYSDRHSNYNKFNVVRYDLLGWIEAKTKGTYTESGVNKSP